MKTIRSLSSLARVVRGVPRPLALVPTMGALHAGHMGLVRKARALVGPGGTVAVSLFVNPAQFGPKEDYTRYPRPFRADARLCREAGVDLLFAPEPGALYAADASTWVEETALSSGLCGASRPGHFRGVCTVVAKLFHLFGPDMALFGRKDVQQLAVIRRMVRDLHFPITIIGMETVREADGLALSSRNRYLSEEERRQAVVLPQALEEAARLARAGAGPQRLRRAAERRIATAPLARVDYVSVVDARTLAPPTRGTRRVLLALAVYFGSTRLIDNRELVLKQSS